MSDHYSASIAPHPQFPDLTAVTLTSGPGAMSAVFVPDAGMVGCSLRHRGAEILGQRAGLGPYRESGKTFGIPLLAPWANRLVARDFGGTGLVTAGTPGVHPDGNGLPIHGLLAGCPDWTVTRCDAAGSGADGGARLEARLDFDQQRPEFPAFPFPFRLVITIRLHQATLTVSTKLTATGEREVPVAFGYHPYFAPPGVPRSEWVLSEPFTRHLAIDDRCVPTGQVESAAGFRGVLGDPERGGHTFDDLFSGVEPGARAWIEGGGRRITLRYDSGYGYAVVFAPADAELVALEPMTAPTDPLSGHFPVSTAAPGETYEAVFSIVVTPAGVTG